MQGHRILMSGDEVKKIRVIRDILDKFITQKKGAQKLKLSTRQVRRLQERYILEGTRGVVHGLCNRPSNNRISLEVEEKIKSLWSEVYRPAEFTYAHFTEKLNEVEGIKVSKEKVRTLLRSTQLVDSKQSKPRKHRQERPRKERFGELLQQDTSPHNWLGVGEKEHLVAIIDDATSKVLFAQLFKSDGTLPNLQAMYEVFRCHGLPLSIYTDRASWFHYSEQGVRVHTHKRNRDNIKKDIVTQIGRAMDELGVDLIPAYSAQAKGRVERMNRTFQDRLISELRLRKITNMDLANEYIRAKFIADHNKRFAVPAKESNSAFVQLANIDCLDNTLCLKYTSTVRPDNIISKVNHYKLQLLPRPERPSWAKAKVEVRIHLDGKITVIHKNTKKEIPYKAIEIKHIKESKNGTHNSLANISD